MFAVYLFAAFTFLLYHSSVLKETFGAYDNFLRSTITVPFWFDKYSYNRSIGFVCNLFYLTPVKSQGELVV